MKDPERTALLLVDLQKYYLLPDSDFARFSALENPKALSYIRKRANTVALPAAEFLLNSFRELSLPIFFLRLCGVEPDRGDLHHLFREAHETGEKLGFPNVYPLADDPAAAIVDELRPRPDEFIFDKTAFSGFTHGDLEERLKEKNIQNLVFAGLATSQCVNTTARDASDRGFVVYQIEDGMADYSEEMHLSALYSSSAVCGGLIFQAMDFIQLIRAALGNDEKN